VKALARDLVGFALSLSGLTAPARFGRGRLNIATFHRVLPEEHRSRYPYPMLAVTPEELGWFLDFFREHFLCTTMEDAWRLYSLGVHPERPILAITFDDAQLDNFVHARPALEVRDLRATFYVPVEAVDRQEPLWHDRLGFAAQGDLVEEAKRWSPEERARRVAELGDVRVPDWARMMTWDQIRRLAAGGHEIGSHSLSHALLPQLDEAAIEREVEGSKARIEERIDRPIQTFCYPNGDADDRSARIVARAGFACAVTTEWGNNDRGADPYRLRRWDMNSRYSTRRSGALSRARVAWRMSGLHPGLRS
jgi:peptidoglycan/xylan/chitin deacetylase (PgdA/CDA1 family)